MAKCINKSDKNYKKLVEKYGDYITEAIVRNMTSQKGMKESPEFYIPSVQEARDFIKNVNKNKLQKIQRGLRANPYLTLKGIADYLQGVITKLNDTFFVVKGFNVGLTQTAINEAEIFKPNLEIMKEIAAEFPDIFKVKPTSKGDTVVVEITPRTKPAKKQPTYTQGNLFAQAQPIEQTFQKLSEFTNEEKETILANYSSKYNVSREQAIFQINQALAANKEETLKILKNCY